jgi:hypothetical protein
MKTNGGMEEQLHAFLTLALDRGYQLHVPAALALGKDLPVSIGEESG